MYKVVDLVQYVHMYIRIHVMTSCMSCHMATRSTRTRAMRAHGDMAWRSAIYPGGAGADMDMGHGIGYRIWPSAVQPH